MALTFDSTTGLYRWQKGDCFKLSDHFTTDEFTCPCIHPECVDQYIHFDMVEKLEDVRSYFGTPLEITSGYRCTRHEADLQKNPQIQTVAPGKLSQHELGKAGDIKIVNQSGSQIEAVAAQHFKAIGVAPSWCHVDLRDDKTRRWTYER